MYWSWWRIAAAVAGASAIAAGFIVNVDRATRYQHDLALVLANYFSLFTVVSTMLSITALVAAAAGAQLHRRAARESFPVALALAAVTGPMILLGIVYNVLLRGVPSAAAAADSAGIHVLDVYAIEMLHVVLPLYLLIDLVFATRRRGLPWSALEVMAVYPLVWIVFTMVRGALTPDPAGVTSWWYPYPFLDPNGPGGWVSVAVYVGVMLAGFVGIGAGIIAIGRVRERRAGVRTAPRARVDVH